MCVLHYVAAVCNVWCVPVDAPCVKRYRVRAFDTSCLLCWHCAGSALECCGERGRCGGREDSRLYERGACHGLSSDTRALWL